MLPNWSFNCLHSFVFSECFSVFVFNKFLLSGMLKDDLTWDKRGASDIKSTTALVEDQSLIPSTHIG